VTIGVREVVLVRFPFSDLSSAKQRPALVLAAIRPRAGLRMIVVAMITSQLDAPRLPGDLTLEAWKQAGLLHPSRLRLAKVATLDESLVVKTLGTLMRRDVDRAKAALREVFSSWL
jgi:mRNA interferase MazF